jgi:N-acetylmuramoyl-L-alanine amidase
VRVSVIHMLLLVACAVREPDPPIARPDPFADQGPPAPIWPARGAPLGLVPLAVPAAWKPPRVLLDPGHGAEGNLGTMSSSCEHEAVFTARTATALVPLLSPDVATVRNARPDEKPVSYDDRIALARRWNADLGIGLHSDARTGTAYSETPDGCPIMTGASGFSVLWSDEGDPAEAQRRHAFAAAIARRMRESGFPAYAGGYGDLYDEDPAQPGVFLDRHADRYRIKMLRRTPMPYVIVETHEAADPEEAARWAELWTITVFARALDAAVLDVSGRGAGDPLVSRF